MKRLAPLLTRLLALTLLGVAHPAAADSVPDPEDAPPPAASAPSGPAGPAPEAAPAPAAPAAPVPAAPDATAVTPAQPATRLAAGPRVLVSRLGLDGSMAPAAGVRVRRERMKRSAGMEGGETLVAAWEARTDASGIATFEDLAAGPGEEDRYAALELGDRFPAEVSRDAPMAPTVTLFARTRDASALSLDLQVGLELRDANFMIQQQFALANGGLAAIDLRHGAGLRIPLLTHAVFGTSLDWGFLPLRPDTRTSRFEAIPADHRVSVEDGALVFRGLVPPGRGVQVRASFAVPYGREASHTLALRADVPLSGLRVGVTAPDASGLRVALGAPHDTAARRAGEATELWLLPHAMPKPGEVVTLHVDHTPDRLQVQRDVGLALGFGVLFALTAVFAATRRRA